MNMFLEIRKISQIQTFARAGLQNVCNVHYVFPDFWVNMRATGKWVVSMETLRNGLQLVVKNS